MLENEIKRMEGEIKISGVYVDNELDSDISNITNGNVQSSSSFMKLFWEQQTNILRNGYKKYHPMIIRFCLSLASKYASTYDELRDSKILTLPSRRTLRDYKNAIRPKEGFNPEIIAELIETASRSTGVQRYVVLSR